MSEMLLTNQISGASNTRVYFEAKDGGDAVWLTVQTIGAASTRVRVLLSLEDATKMADAIADAVIESKKAYPS